MKQFSLEEYLKDPPKKAVTRDGRNVKIDCTDFVAKVEGDGLSQMFYSASFGAILYTPREEAEDVGKTDVYYAATAKIEWEE